MQRIDFILGTLYGQAIGDAMGMPSELWPASKIKDRFGQITTFLDGPSDNDVAINFTKGMYTDDTNQAFAILDGLIENNWQPDETILMTQILNWADRAGAWENNILGPSSKAALNAFKRGKYTEKVTGMAITNGAGMRIAPIGTLFDPSQIDDLVTLVFNVSKVTHSSDVAISGAALIAGAVSAAVSGADWDEIIHFSLRAAKKGMALGQPTWAAKIVDRLLLGIKLANKYSNDAQTFSQKIYDVLGTGTMSSESIPTALTIAYYTRDVKQCALMCANLGGDTDTIGAMATAVCGAKNGVASIPPEWIQLIDKNNSQHCIQNYADKILGFIG